MIWFILSAVFVGALGALGLVLLHRANEAMTRRALVGVVRQNAPEAATGHPWACSATGARPGPAMAAYGQYRRYGSDLPRIERGKTTVRQYKRNRLGPGAASVGAVEIVNTVPHHAPSTGSDVIVPMMQSIITAIVVTLLIGVLAVIAGRTDVLRVLAVSFVVTLCVSWLWRLGIVTGLLQTVERIVQDLDDDDEPAEDPAHLMAVQPDQARQTVATETRQRVYDERLAWLVGFVNRCYTLGTSESAQGIKPGDRAKYLEARDLLFRLGLADWRDEQNKRLGWIMKTNQAMTVKTLREHTTTV